MFKYFNISQIMKNNKITPGLEVMSKGKLAASIIRKKDILKL